VTLKFYAVSAEVFDHNHVQIQYGPDPLGAFRYVTRERAAVACVRLNQIQFHGGSHCCALTVEQLPDGEFGLICVCHPFGSGSGVFRIPHGRLKITIHGPFEATEPRRPLP